MNNEEIEKIVNLRALLIDRFNRLDEYKRDRNAIMKQVDHAELISETIKQIDAILKGHVNFS